MGYSTYTIGTSWQNYTFAAWDLTLKDPSLGYWDCLFFLQYSYSLSGVTENNYNRQALFDSKKRKLSIYLTDYSLSDLTLTINIIGGISFDKHNDT